MSEITSIPSPAAAPRFAAFARFFAKLHSLRVKPDLVLIGLAALFTGLWVCSPGQAIITARYVARELAEIGPWLVASVCLAAAALATGLDQLAAKAFTGRESRMIIVASMLGAALPFCSCGVIPLVAGLLGAGVPLAPVMAFWISCPLMDPPQFFIASGVLGVGFATAKMLSAVGMGILSGFGTMMLVRAGWLDAPAALRINAMSTRSCCGSKPAAVTASPPAKSCRGSATVASDPALAAPKPVVLWRFWTDAASAQRFLTTATSTGWFLARWLAVAYALESLMVAWLPTNLVGQWLGAGAGPLAVPLAVAIGIPVYLNSFAAIPFVSGLIGLGMSPATGLAFMLATTGTGFPAMVAVWALVKPRAFALYLGFAITGALIAGYAYAAALAMTAH
jgi:uncharacterized membrane protein YraQ (UPF0718 family)